MRVIAFFVITLFAFMSTGIGVASASQDLSFEFEIVEQFYAGEEFEDLEVVANLGHSLAAIYINGEIPIFLPIKINSDTNIISLSKSKVARLKKGDIIDLWSNEVKEGFYIANEILLKERPTPTATQIKNGGKNGYRNREDNFQLVPDEVGLISKIIVDTNFQNVYVYGPDEEVWYISRTVTGKRGWRIPRGNYKIFTKERNRYLDGTQYGEDYHLWIYYWMPFYGGAGLHDAGWRNTFWINHDYYGSHGCINLPHATAKFIYAHSKVGTRVIVR